MCLLSFACLFCLICGYLFAGLLVCCVCRLCFGCFDFVYLFVGVFGCDCRCFLLSCLL